MMTNTLITWHSFAPDVRINIDQEDLVIPTAARVKAEQFWQSTAQKGQDALFNGRLFSVQDYNEQTITVRPTEFKYFHAQINDARISDSLYVRPLACSGVLTCEDGFIFAQRSTKVTLDKGLWELAPSGTFDDSCIFDGAHLSSTVLIETEMREELGIPESRISTQQLKGGIANEKTGALDLVISIELDARQREIEGYFSNRPSDEYNNVRVVPASQICQFMKDVARNFSRSTKVILKELSLMELEI